MQCAVICRICFARLNLYSVWIASSSYYAASRCVVEHAVCVFFFQAEDGIRDWSVTGVQTCALPIFTFQTLDKRGMVLNMAQTWHQLRPGEVRTNCGGCHAHSQQPTPFERTAAAK